MNTGNKDDDLDYNDLDPKKHNDDPETEPDFKTGVAQHDNQTSGISLNYHEKQEDDSTAERNRRMGNLEKLYYQYTSLLKAEHVVSAKS
eukprot:3915213-Ditylum_brightwellii.AAC.1